MTAKEKLAQKRLTLLQLAEALGNVSKACRDGKKVGLKKADITGTIKNVWGRK